MAMGLYSLGDSACTGPIQPEGCIVLILFEFEGVCGFREARDLVLASILVAQSMSVYHHASYITFSG